MNVNEPISPGVPPKHSKGSTRMPTTLLVISDEVGSARSSSAETKERVPRHFAEFLKLLLSPPHLERDGSYVVKNVGDSLMIRIAVTPKNNEVGNLLHRILLAQRNLATLPGRKAIKIRVFVAKCEDCVCGHEIGERLQKELNEEEIALTKSKNKLPPPRNPEAAWFDGDMFGDAVNIAFRAAAIPRGTELIIEEEVTRLLFKESTIRYGEEEANVKGLHISHAVAFTPVRGMEDLYDVGKEHLTLREVSLKNSAGAALSKRQQKARVITELWWGEAGDAEIIGCKNELMKIDNGAGFFHFSGLVKEHSCNKLGTGEEPRLILFGAYPEFDTYWSIRNELRARRGRDKILGKSITSIVWEQFADPKWEPTLWSSQNARAFIFVKLKARNPTDDPASDPTVHALTNNPGLLPTFKLHDAGLLMGEWDAYAIFTSKADLPKDPLLKNVTKSLKAIFSGVARDFAIYVGRVIGLAGPSRFGRDFKGLVHVGKGGR
jgi:hypothetical protein